MSAARDLEPDEAEDVEAAEDDEQPITEEDAAEGAETPAPEPEPRQQALTESAAERIIDQADKAGLRYFETQAKRLAPLDLPLEPCPLCRWPGLAIARSANEVTSDVEGAVLRLIGQSAPQEFNTSEGYAVCEVCDGWGEVLTGAKKAISRTATCPNPNCGGKGYVQRPIAVAPLPPPVPFPGASVAYTPLPTGVPDQWQRPAGHPHWGIDPATIGA